MLEQQWILDSDSSSTSNAGRGGLKLMLNDGVCLKLIGICSSQNDSSKSKSYTESAPLQPQQLLNRLTNLPHRKVLLAPTYTSTQMSVIGMSIYSWSNICVFSRTLLASRSAMYRNSVCRLQVLSATLVTILTWVKFSTMSYWHFASYCSLSIWLSSSRL